MSIRRSSIVLIVLGATLVVLAALTKFVVEPSVSKMPTSLDVTNTYTGTGTGTGTLLNAAAVQAGDMQNAVARDVPVSVMRHTYVSDSDEYPQVLCRFFLRKDEAHAQEDRSRGTGASTAVAG